VNVYFSDEEQPCFCQNSSLYFTRRAPSALYEFENKLVFFRINIHTLSAVKGVNMSLTRPFTCSIDHYLFRHKKRGSTFLTHVLLLLIWLTYFLKKETFIWCQGHWITMSSVRLPNCTKPTTVFSVYLLQFEPLFWLLSCSAIHVNAFLFVTTLFANIVVQFEQLF